MAIGGRYTGIRLTALTMFRFNIYNQVLCLWQMLNQVVVSDDRPRRFRSPMPHPLTRLAVLPKTLTILGLHTMGIGCKHPKIFRFTVWWRDGGGHPPNCPTILPQLLVKIIHPSTVPSISWIHLQRPVMHTRYQYAFR